MTERAPVPVPPDRHAPFGLYVHFPFCAQRCHYCAFYFVVGQQELRARYVDAVEAELKRASRDPRFRGRAIHSVYFGGGTPSLMAPADVQRLLAAATRAFPSADPLEVSLESNPDHLEKDRLAALRDAGVNRLTLGWQSLSDGNLRLLTRTHTADDNRRALQAARRAGFDNLAVDLIFGVPGQTHADWVAELEETVELGPDHVSAYELTLEEGTRLTRRHEQGRFDLADEEERARMFEATERVLAQGDLHPYEISNFARPGRECLHNASGWRSGDLLGVGASAASHVTNARWHNRKDLTAYLRGLETGTDVQEEAELLDEATWAAEDLYLGLRTRAGLDVERRLARVDERRRGLLVAALERAEERGWLEGAPIRRLTRRGRLLADTLFDELLGAVAIR